MPHTDNRHFPRVFFPDEAHISGNFSHADSDDQPFPAIIVNMSEGGIGISTRSRFSGDLREGQRLQLDFIKVAGSTSPLRNILTRVQWVLEEIGSDKLIVGLEFRGIDELTRGLVRQLVENTQEGAPRR